MPSTSFTTPCQTVDRHCGLIFRASAFRELRATKPVPALETKLVLRFLCLLSRCGCSARPNGLVLIKRVPWVILRDWRTFLDILVSQADSARISSFACVYLCDLFLCATPRTKQSDTKCSSRNSVLCSRSPRRESFSVNPVLQSLFSHFFGIWIFRVWLLTTCPQNLIPPTSGRCT